MRLTRGVQVLGGLVTSFLLLTAFTPLANGLAYWRAPGGPLGAADAIVVLGGGGTTESGQLSALSLGVTFEGVDLYRRGLAPLLVLSGSLSGVVRQEAEARAQIADASGIPGLAVVKLNAARTTHEEALDARAVLWPRGIRRIILVTDAVSMARSAGAFEKVGFAVTPSYGMPVLRWGGSPGARVRLMQETLIELVACVYYRTRGWV
jgi:uncharacterized SAM-binding protein YcdF (DUF218 family)